MFKIIKVWNWISKGLNLHRSAFQMELSIIIVLDGIQNLLIMNKNVGLI